MSNEANGESMRGLNIESISLQRHKQATVTFVTTTGRGYTFINATNHRGAAPSLQPLMTTGRATYFQTIVAKHKYDSFLHSIFTELASATVHAGVCGVCL